MQSIELVLGQTWKEDVRYLSELRPYRPAEAPLNLVEIYDIIDLVVGGTNLTAGIAEESIFGFVAQLLEDLVRLVTGLSRKAIVEFHCEAWELTLVPSGPEFLLSLYSLDHARRVVAHDARVDAHAFVRTVANAAETLLTDLLAIWDGFASDPFIRRFSAHLAQLRRTKSFEFAPSPPRTESLGIQSGSTSTGSGLTLTYGLDADDAGLLGYDGEHVFDLHALLFDGRIEVEDRDRVVTISERYPFLTLQSLVRRIRELLSLLEASADSVDCRDAMAHLRFDVTGTPTRWEVVIGPPQSDRPGGGGDEVEAVRTSVAPVSCLDTMLTMAEMILADVVAANPRLELNQRYVDVQEEVAELRHWLGDISDTNVYMDRPEEFLRAHADVRPVDDVAPQVGFAWPLRDVRALYPRHRWQFQAPQIHFSSVSIARGRLLVPTMDDLHCLEVDTGRRAWSRGADRARLSSYAQAGERIVVADEREGVDLVDLDSGERIGSADAVASLLLGAAHYPDDELVVVADFHGRVAALDDRDGSVRWRHEASHGYLSGAAWEGPLFCTLSSPGFLQAFNPRSGESLWKVRLGGVAASGPHFHQGRIYTLSQDPVTAFLTVHAFLPYTGRAAWQLRLEGRIVGRVSFVGTWMILPLERHGRVSLVALPTESHQAEPAWSVDLASAGVDRPTVVEPVEIDGELHGLVRTDRAVLACFRVEDGEVRWITRSEQAGPLLFRNLDLVRIRDSVLSAGERFEIHAIDDGRLLHRFGEVMVAPEYLAATGALDIVVGEAGATENDPDGLQAFSLRNFLALVPEA